MLMQQGGMGEGGFRCAAGWGERSLETEDVKRHLRISRVSDKTKHIGRRAGFLPVGDATVGIGIAFFRLIRSQIYSFNQFDIEIINSDLICGVRVFFFFLPPMPAVHFFFKCHEDAVQYC